MPDLVIHKREHRPHGHADHGPTQALIPSEQGDHWNRFHTTVKHLMPKHVPNTTEPLALSATGSSIPTLEKFKLAIDRQRWLLRTS